MSWMAECSSVKSSDLESCRWGAKLMVWMVGWCIRCRSVLSASKQSLLNKLRSSWCYGFQIWCRSEHRSTGISAHYYCTAQVHSLSRWTSARPTGEHLSVRHSAAALQHVESVTSCKHNCLLQIRDYLSVVEEGPRCTMREVTDPQLLERVEDFCNESGYVNQLTSLFLYYAAGQSAISARQMHQMLHDAKLGESTDEQEKLQRVYLANTPAVEEEAGGWLTAQQFVPFLVALAEAKFESQDPFTAAVRMIVSHVLPLGYENAPQKAPSRTPSRAGSAAGSRRGSASTKRATKPEGGWFSQSTRPQNTSSKQGASKPEGGWFSQSVRPQKASSKHQGDWFAQSR